MVIKQGEQGDNFYAIQSGTFTVMVENAGQTMEVGDLEGGKTFGELSLMYV